MSSDYEAITKYNERQLGLDTESRKTQISMYSDPTHFIYEILQNADDYGATEVIFKLSKDKLIIEHNGEPFTEENVKAITYFGKSTSREDLVKTGRFGVGFKSVFAYTANPTIFSGDEHFQIYGLYRIKEQPYPNELSSSLTQIILPFNHESEQPNYVEKLVSPKEAYTKISNRLKKLNMNTLLFTLNIQEIRWEIDNHSGNYYREDVVYDNSEIDNVRKTTITDGNKLKEYWVFSKIPRWKNQNYKAIDVAFAIDENNQLMPVNDFLFVLFATTEKPDLKFILNGPYRTNPSRETISEDDKFNQHLIKETCELFKEILPNLKKMDLLTTHFLNVLPSGNDNLREFYTPLLNIIIETFNNDELVPTDDDQFASSANIFQGPALLREVITKEELQFFTGYDNALWAKGVQQNSRADYFLRDLDIEHWSWETLQYTLNKKYNAYGMYGFYGEDNDYTWLAQRSDSWLQKLYLLIAEAIRKDDCSGYVMKKCSLVRVIENGKEKHIAGSYAYFPKGRSYKDLPQIKRTILRGRNEQETLKIQESLVTLGVSEIGEEERIDLLLETFYNDEATKIANKQHLQHINTFIDWYKKTGRTDKFKSVSIFKSVRNGDFYLPTKCFLDSPLQKTGLSVIYSKLKSGIPLKVKLWSGYRKLASKGFLKFAIECGVADGLSILSQSCRNHTQWTEMREDYWARHTYTGIDEDYYIPNLNTLLDKKVRGISQLIWQSVSKADPKEFEATFRPNQQYETRTRKSSFLLLLIDAAWIPNKRGQLKKPSELTREQLHRDFKYDNRNGWLDEIEFGEESKKASKEYNTLKEGASAYGIPIEQLNFLAALTEEEKDNFNKEIKALVKLKEKEHNKAKRSRQENIPFHEALSGAFTSKIRHTTIQNQRGHGSTKNPSRRRKRVSEDIAVAIENENHIKERFSFTLRKKWKGKDDQVRVTLAEWYEGKCQICRETFIQRSGEPYFEGLYLVPYTNAEWLDRVGNVICLCALHSSMFQFGPKEIEEDIISQIMKMSVELEGGDGEPAISMKLCGNMININYAENHLIDLQEMIKLDQGSERNQKGEEN